MACGSRSSSFVVAVLLAAGLAACTDRSPTLPTLSASNTSSGSLTVTSAAPDSAPQDTTLDVHVFGSGFDRGSNAQWAQSGTVSPYVKTNSTKFVSSGELVANITIALTATVGSYDVIVTTSQGKKGIGTELFTITLKHNAVASVTVTPATNTIAVGSSVQFQATAYNSSGTVLSKAVFTWATSNTAVALVSGTGMLTAVGAGSATITATSGSASGNSTVATVANLTFATVRSGVGYSCGLVTGGAAFCWGRNNQYQLGNGSSTEVNGPSAVSGGLLFNTLSVQYAGACGLVSGGQAWCWGSPGEPTSSGGALGGGFANAPAPAALVGGLSFTTISEGDASACGLDAGGVAYCWGWNSAGQLGNGTTIDSPTPVAVSGGLTFSSISVGATDHVCAVTTGGAAYCWGSNGGGELGNGNTTSSSIPVPVSGGLTFTAISAGWANSCGITSSGMGYCWGVNAYGQLGNGTTINSSSPVPVSGGLSFSAISASQSPCALTTGGAVYCWGFNKWGQLGNGTTTNSSIPVPVSGRLTFTTISGGGQNACGITTSGVTYCWGYNNTGQVGDGTQTDRWSPVKVVGQP